jgi:hypothetical protein
MFWFQELVAFNMSLQSEFYQPQNNVTFFLLQRRYECSRKCTERLLGKHLYERHKRSCDGHSSVNGDLYCERPSTSTKWQKTWSVRAELSAVTDGDVSGSVRHTDRCHAQCDGFATCVMLLLFPRLHNCSDRISVTGIQNLCPESFQKPYEHWHCPRGMWCEQAEGPCYGLRLLNRNWMERLSVTDHWQWVVISEPLWNSSGGEARDTRHMFCVSVMCLASVLSALRYTTQRPCAQKKYCIFSNLIRT